MQFRLFGVLGTVCGTPFFRRPRPRAGSAQVDLIPSKATLILVPTNLLLQWETEFHKFFGKDALKIYTVAEHVIARTGTFEGRKCRKHADCGW